MAWVEQCGNRTWRVRYRRDDDTIGAVSGFTTKTAATEHANSLEADQREGRFLDPAAGQITLTEWSQDWLQALDVAIRTEDVKLRVRAGSTGRTNTRAARISTSQTARGMWSGTSSGTASGASSEIPWRIMRAAGDHQSPLASGMCSILEP